MNIHQAIDLAITVLMVLDAKIPPSRLPVPSYQPRAPIEHRMPIVPRPAPVERVAPPIQQAPEHVQPSLPPSPPPAWQAPAGHRNFIPPKSYRKNHRTVVERPKGAPNEFDTKVLPKGKMVLKNNKFIYVPNE